jgi:hypothetical protein
VFLCQDPSWRLWEEKQVYLLDNFLLEATIDGAKVLGYAPLCNAKIEKCPFTNPDKRRNYNNTTTSTTNNHYQVHEETDSGPFSHSIKAFSVSKQDLSYALIITFNNKCEVNSSRSKFWLTCQEESQLDVIGAALIRASRLKVEDLFHLPNEEGNQILGRGLFVSSLISLFVC